MKQQTKTNKPKNWKTPAELSGKRKSAYKKIMKITSDQPENLQTIYDVLSIEYERRSAIKKLVQDFHKNPKIPLKLESQKLVNQV